MTVMEDGKRGRVAIDLKFQWLLFTGVTEATIDLGFSVGGWVVFDGGGRKRWW